MQDLHAINNMPDLEASSLHHERLRVEYNTASQPATRSKREATIQQKNNRAVRTATFDSFLWGIAFTGMLLACVVPGCQIAVLTVIGVASALYLAKNATKFTHCISKFFQQPSPVNHLPVEKKERAASIGIQVSG